MRLRVLNITANIDFGGIESYLFANASNLKKDTITYDILSGHIKETEMIRKIRCTGSQVVLISRRRKFIRHYLETFMFLFKHRSDYDIIHVHMIEKSYMTLFIAFLCGYKIRIAHSHTSFLGQKISLKTRLACKLTSFWANGHIGCSRSACDFLFGKDDTKAFIAKNGIEYSDYIFNDEVREKYRQELGLNDEFVIGHVGRLEEEKNHLFMCELIKELLSVEKNVKMYFIGDGSERGKIESYISENKLDNNVFLLGARSDVPQILNMIDCFILPSKHEGFPITLLEAQVNGLPCVVSDRVTMETKITDKIQYLPINDCKRWFDSLIDVMNSNFKHKRDFIGDWSFDIRNSTEELVDYYKMMLNQKL